MKKFIQRAISFLEKTGNLHEDVRRRWARALFVLMLVPALFLWLLTLKFSISDRSSTDMLESAAVKGSEVFGQASKGMGYLWSTLKFVRQEAINETEKENENPPQEFQRVHLPIVE